MVSKKKKVYSEDALMVSRHNCPYCNSSNLDRTLTEEEMGEYPDSAFRYYMITCLDCNKTWCLSVFIEPTVWMLIDLNENVIGKYSLRAKGPLYNRRSARRSRR